MLLGIPLSSDAPSSDSDHSLDRESDDAAPVTAGHRTALHVSLAASAEARRRSPWLFQRRAPRRQSMMWPAADEEAAVASDAGAGVGLGASVLIDDDAGGLAGAGPGDIAADTEGRARRRATRAGDAATAAHHIEDGEGGDADHEQDAAAVAADAADFDAAVFGAGEDPPPFSFAQAGYEPVRAAAWCCCLVVVN